MGDADGAPPPEIQGDEPLTGWRLLAQHESVVKIVDALLDMPPHREFNKTELSKFANVSRKSVHTHLPTLERLNLVQPVPETTPTRYRFNTESEIADCLIRLDGAVNRAGPNDPTELTSSSD